MITNNYTPYAGGVVRAIQTYTHELQRQGHTVYIITLDFGVTDDPWFVLRVPSVLCFRYRNNPACIPWRPYRYIYNWLCQLSPDLVHIHTPFLLGSSGVKAAQRLSIPVIFTYHSLYERFVSYVPVPQKLAGSFVLWSVRRFCRQCDGAIAPSQHILNRLTSMQPPERRHCVPTPIRMKLMPSQRACMSKDKPTIISVGRFQPEKQTHHIIDAFSRVRSNARLVLIGFGASYTYLRWYAYTYCGLRQEHVTFVLHPDLPQLIAWYQAADIFVSASCEAQGLVFAEALAHGVPVVAYADSGAEDTLVHKTHGLLGTDKQDMADALTYLCDHRTVWQRMRDRAYARGRLYHPHYRTQQLLDVYRQYVHRQ